MPRKCAVLLMCTVVVSYVVQMHAIARPAHDVIHIIGTGTGLDGRVFAVLRGVGVVAEGDIVPMVTSNVSYKVEIVAISMAGLEVRKREIVRKPAPRPKPKSVPLAGKRHTIRDPFWPVGYVPEDG